MVRVQLLDQIELIAAEHILGSNIYVRDNVPPTLKLLYFLFLFTNCFLYIFLG